MIWIMKKIIEGTATSAYMPSVVDEYTLVSAYSKLLGLLVDLIQKVPEYAKAILNQPFVLFVLKWGLESDNVTAKCSAEFIQRHSNKYSE